MIRTRQALALIRASELLRGPSSGTWGEIVMSHVRHANVFTKPATLRHLSVSHSIGYEIHEFLAQEALFLDYGHYDNWTTLLATDVVYRCPIRVLGVSGDHTTLPTAEGMHDYDYDSLVSHTRSIQRAASDSQHGTTARRMVCNVLVSPGQRTKEFLVTSYVLITGALGNEPEARLMTVERRDILRRCSYFYRLARREIRLGQISGNAMELARVL
jgi:hypothetical protein